MVEVDRQALVPHSAEQMFSLVDDIESYASYLPSCDRATILRRDGNLVDAELCLSKSGFQQCFSTRNLNTPFESIKMELLDGPFVFLNGDWNFTEVESLGCRVDFHLQFEMKRSFFSGMISSAVVDASNKLVDVICQRAEQLYKSD